MWVSESQRFTTCNSLTWWSRALEGGKGTMKMNCFLKFTVLHSLCFGSLVLIKSVIGIDYSWWYSVSRGKRSEGGRWNGLEWGWRWREWRMKRENERVSWKNHKSSTCSASSLSSYGEYVMTLLLRWQSSLKV